MKKVLVILVLSLFACYSSLEEDYYWREYFGTPPGDAVVAGKSLDGNNIYIGQAYIKNVGLIAVQITPGQKEVSVTYDGIKKVDKYIKILCGPQEKFYWMKVNATDLHVQITDKHAVLGGYEDKYGYMNVGRISQAGEVKIGKINSFWVENAYFYYNDNGSERKLRSYEILMYKDGNTDIDVRISAE